MNRSKIYHLKLADYFERHPHQHVMTTRKAAEWPYQLNIAEAWDQLEMSLTNIPLFIELYNDNTKWELTSYWQVLRSKGRDLHDCYLTAHEAWIADRTNSSNYLVPFHLGTFLFENGIFSAAERLLKEALEKSKSILGNEHSDTLSIENNLALVFLNTGNFIDAEPILRRVLEVRLRLLGAEHSDTITSTNNMAELLQYTGNLVEAEKLLRQTLEITERVFGPIHPYTLNSLNNLGFLLLDSKEDYKGAEPIYRRAMDGRVKTHGLMQPATLESINNLAFLLQKKGDILGAELLYRQSLEGRKQVLGPEHPLTLESINNLAFLLVSKGDYTMAESLYQQALEGLLKVSVELKHPHPNLEAFVCNYARCLEKIGRSPEDIRIILNSIIYPYGMNLE